MKIGCHVSGISSYDKLFEYARDVGCECMQMFTKSPRVWEGKKLDADRIALFKESHAKCGNIPIVAHGAYLLNIISNDDGLIKKAQNGLADEITRACALGIKYVNIHCGSAKDVSRKELAKRCSDSIHIARDIAGESAEQVCLLLENSAGGKNTYGSTVEELAWVIHESGLSAKELSITIDTAHAWAVGYNLANKRGWDNLIGEFNDNDVLERFLWIHANDSKYERALRKDRHEWIGEGLIGLEGFKVMCTHTDLQNVLVACEMPGEMPEKDERNVQLLQSLRDGEN